MENFVDFQSKNHTGQSEKDTDCIRGYSNQGREPDRSLNSAQLKRRLHASSQLKPTLGAVAPKIRLPSWGHNQIHWLVHDGEGWEYKGTCSRSKWSNSAGRSHLQCFLGINHGLVAFLFFFLQMYFSSTFLSVPTSFSPSQWTNFWSTNLKPEFVLQGIQPVVADSRAYVRKGYFRAGSPTIWLAVS